MNMTTAISRFLAVTAFVLCLTVRAFAANTTTEVEQVAETVALTTDVDYVITGTTPFGANGVVDIQNTDHAVLILLHVRPSKAKLLLASHVKINGQAAVNGENCQLKIYREGSIIMPYAKDIKPLTIYTDAGQQGDSQSFAVGERTELSGKFNNNIESFVLKRGYMATFFMQADGKGYSRIFISDKMDRSVNLPSPLKNTVSAVRVMRWHDATKKGLGGRDQTLNEALGTTWCYNWDAGNDAYEDRQFVTQRHHESGVKNGKYEGAWPSVEACNAYGSEHILGHNEPENVSDPREVVSNVDMVLDIWPELMATGKRLCSPAVSGNYNWLYEFMDSIDARGWRCDVVAVHAYWYNDWGSWNSTLSGIHNRTGRPLWITEMNYGANWTGWPGSDRSGSEANQNIQLQHMGPIIDGLENASYLERYAYYNNVEECRYIWLDGKLTKIGEYYAAKESKIAYNASQEYVPKLPRQYAPSGLAVDYDKKTRQAVVSWNDRNGEFNQKMVLQRSTDGGTTWSDYYTPTQKETASAYSYIDEHSRDGYRYRVLLMDGNNTEQKSIEVVAAISNIEAGDAVSVGETTMYVGGNMLINGDFDLGFTGWTNGKGLPISYPNFQIANVGGELGNHLVSWSSQMASGEGSIRTLFDVVPNGQYYFAAKFCNTGGQYQSIDVEDPGDNDKVVETPVFKTIACSDWTLQDGNFNVGNHSQIFFKFRWLNMARMDQCFLARLFPTFEEAQADALQQVCRRAQAFISYNTVEVLNTELQGVLNATYPSQAESLAAIEHALDMAYAAFRQLGELKKLTDLATTYIALGMPGSDALVPHVTTARSYTSAAQVVEVIHDFNEAFATMPVWETTGLVQNGEVNSAYAWQNKSTYGGDQRSHTVLGRTCWNSWWSGTSAKVGDGIMKIQQTLTGLDEGLYYLTCDATTEHSCISDQHAFMMNGDEIAVSPVLTYDRFDYPGIANADRWETLATTPLHVGEADTLYVGFESSKQGAIDGAWIANPDKTTPDYREGWWCATGFKLHRLPLHQRRMTAAHWGTVCLPAAVTPGPGVQLYEVAGVLTENEQQYICLSPLAEQTAGVPFVYYCDRSQANFFEKGEAVTTAVAGANNLRGALTTNILSRRSAGAMVMVNGAFYQLGESELPYTIDKYQAYINKLTNVTELTSWDGIKLPLYPQGTLAGVTGPIVGVAAPSTIYTLQGRPATGTTSGVVIQRQGNQTRKVLQK